MPLRKVVIKKIKMGVIKTQIKDMEKKCVDDVPVKRKLLKNLTQHFLYIFFLL